MSELDDFRQQKDAFFRDEAESPLPPAERSRFAGLRYFEEQADLVFELEPELLTPRELVEMQTSTGDTATYERWARIRFAVDGVPAELVLYRDPHSGSLFLPFRDATSGDESYGAGRYLEVVPNEDGTLHVDFNYAHNPYCAYSEHWSCPIPPAENRLRVPIRAGEQAFH